MEIESLFGKGGERGCNGKGDDESFLLSHSKNFFFL